MSLRSLLILTYNFPPSSASGSFRMLGFVRHLPKHGWRAVVVAPPAMPWEPTDRGLLDQVPAETVVYHVPYPRGRGSKVVRRLAPFAGWFPGAWAACGRAVRVLRPDAMLTSGPPHSIHTLGLLVSRRHRLPWAADFRDPWITDGGFGFGVWSPRSRREALLERAVMRCADVIIANTPGACAMLGAAYPARKHKMVAITNGYDPDGFARRAAPGPPDGTLTIVHAGEIYAGRDPRPFLDAIRGLEDDRNGAGGPTRVKFLGRHNDPTIDLAAEIRRRGLEAAISLGGQVPYDQTLDELVGADILLLMDNPGRRIGVPAKLYEYIGAGRPILALAEPDGDLAWVLRESGVPHRIASPTDPGAIRRSLAELAAARAGQTGVPGAGRGHSFERAHLAGRLARVLDACVARAGGGPEDAPAGPPGGGEAGAWNAISMS